VTLGAVTAVVTIECSGGKRLGMDFASKHLGMQVAPHRCHGSRRSSCVVRRAWLDSGDRRAPRWLARLKAGGPTMTLVIGVVVTLLVILGVLVKMWDLKRKRESEAVIVQSQISDALLQEPALFSLAITPTAHVPLWKGSPVTVEVAGQVPSDDLRQAALRVIEREASRLRSDVQVESRLGVVPAMAERRSA
jgi:hypothetical protein